MLVNYFWIILIVAVAIKLVKGKELSSYNIKWLVIYTIYVAYFQVEYGTYNYKDYWSRFDFTFGVFFIPLLAYLLFPFIYKYIKNWKIVKWIDKLIDSCYNSIKKYNQHT